MMMNPVRRKKFVMLIIMMSILGLATGLVLYALRQNISLFYTPTQISQGQAPFDHHVRVGGMVVKDSIQRSGQDLVVRFRITDYQNTIEVAYQGILPDLFREEQGIVAMGKLIDRQHFKATEVLAKHDENYMPPEVKAALANHKESR